MDNYGYKNICHYYRKQAGLKQYLDALFLLTAPCQDDVILDVGTGSGAVSFFLGDHVKKIYAIDPNASLITQNQQKSQKLIKDREVSHSFNVEFQEEN